MAEFSLETSIATWRRPLLANGLRRDQLAELEDHLRSGIDLAMAAGMAQAAAFAHQCDQLGESRAVAHEFHKEMNMNPLSKLVGLTIAIAAILAVIKLEGGHAMVLFALPPLLMVLGISLGGLVASHGLRRVMRVFAVAFGGRLAHPDEAEELRWICRRGQRLAYSGGVLQAVLGVMHICSVLDQPSLIGPGIAYSLIGLVHAVLLAELGYGTAERWVAGWHEDQSLGRATPPHATES